MRKYSKIYLYILFIIIIFFKIISWHASVWQDYETLSDFEENEIHELTVMVCDVPKVNINSVSFTAKIISGVKLLNKINVRIKYGERLGLAYGDIIKLNGPLSLADSAMNPGNFDYRKYLESQGVCALMYTDITKISSVKSGRLNGFYNIRTKLTKRIFKYLPHNEASLINALVTGSKNEMADSIEEFFKRSGVYHIVAVSGLHLNMFIIFLSYLYIKLPVKTRQKQLIMIIVNTLGMVFLLMFTGYGVSIKRAAIMGLILCIAPFANREYSPIHALLTAMAVILFTEPYAYKDVSFQLSFLATAGIVTASSIIRKYQIHNRKFAFIIENILITGFSWIFTFPSTVNAFHGVSLVTLISNMTILLFVPVLLAFAYIFAIICILGIKSLCTFAACIVIVPAKAVILLAELFSSIPNAYIPMSQAGMLLITAEIILLALVFRSIKTDSRKHLCTLMCLIIIANSLFVLYNKNRGKCELDFINVGQGECAIIRTPHGRSIMVDCGSDSVNNLYQNNVMPYMDYEGIYKIDFAIITHYHSDHTSGIIPMIEDGRIKTLILPDRLTADDEDKTAQQIIKAAVNADVPITFLSDEHTLEIDSESEIEFMNPEKRTRADANEASFVFKFTCYDTSVLFTGDIEELSQCRLLEKDIKSDILKVPHHGGYSTLSDNFAEAVRCKYAVISCGVDNKYSHPNEKTLETYSDSKILRTDINKTIKFIIEKNGIRHYTWVED